MDFSLENIPELFFEHSQKIGAAISITLIILMSLTVADSVLVVLEAASPRTSTHSAAQTIQPRENKQHKVSDLELFGKATETKAVQQVLDAPTTNLNLELRGVFIAEDKVQSTAIVGERKKPGELFQIGDRLPGNATLAAVYEDHIILRRGSRIEKLMFADIKYRIEKSERRSVEISNGGSNAASQNASNLERIRDRIRHRTAPILTIPAQSPSSDMVAYSEKFRNNPIATLNEAGITPVSTVDSEGYRIGENTNSPIRQVGLQPGDVVLSVNGHAIGTATNDSALIDQVLASARVRVEVQRGERRFFLTVPVPK